MSDRERTPDESEQSGSVKSEDSPPVTRKPAARQKAHSPSRSRSRTSYRSRSRSRSYSRNRGHRRRQRRSYSRSRSRSYHKYSRSRSRSPHYRRRSRESRSRSRGRYSPYYQDNGYSRDRRRRSYRSGSRSPARRYVARDTSPMSSRRRHVGNRDNPNPTRCLGVFGLSLYTQERDLREVFSRYGSVEEVQVVYDRQSGRSRGFAFIHFRSVDDSIEAKDRCTGIEIDGRRIRVDYSITERAHTPTPGIYLGKPTTGYSSKRRSPSPYYSKRSRYSYSRSRSRS